MDAEIFARGERCLEGIGQKGDDCLIDCNWLNVIKILSWLIVVVVMKTDEIMLWLIVAQPVLRVSDSAFQDKAKWTDEYMSTGRIWEKQNTQPINSLFAVWELFVENIHVSHKASSSGSNRWRYGTARESLHTVLSNIYILVALKINYGFYFVTFFYF